MAKFAPLFFLEEFNRASKSQTTAQQLSARHHFDQRRNLGRHSFIRDGKDQTNRCQVSKIKEYIIRSLSYCNSLIGSDHTQCIPPNTLLDN